MGGFSLVHWLILLIPVVAVAAFVLGTRSGRSRRDDLMVPRSPRPPRPSLGEGGKAEAGSMAMPGATTLPSEVETRVWVELRDGKVVNAVKLVRDSTGLGLKDAKDLVDEMRRRDPQLR